MALKVIFFGLMVSGIIISIWGLMDYNQAERTPDLRPQGASPIRLGYTSRMEVERMVLTFDIASEEIQFDAQFRVLDAGENRFQIILPYQVRDVVYDGGYGTWTHRNATSGSVVVSTFSKPVDSEHVRVIALAKIEGAMVQSDRGRYILKLPFGGDIPDDIRKTRELLPGVSIVAGELNFDVLIRLPSDAFFSSSTHNFLPKRNNVDGSELLQLKMENLEQLVIVQYAIPREIRGYEELRFRSGLLLGLGIPLAISSGAELARIILKKSSED